MIATTLLLHSGLDREVSIRYKLKTNAASLPARHTRTRCDANDNKISSTTHPYAAEALNWTVETLASAD
jgi:hypothetical protein